MGQTGVEPLQSDRVLITELIEACADVITRNASYLCELDRAIGDGDHGTNMARGAAAVLHQRDSLSYLPLAEAIAEIGNLLVLNIGGASGPLYGTLLLELSRQLISGQSLDPALALAIEAVGRRGRSKAGDKTLLDVLYPVQTAVSERLEPSVFFELAWQAAQMTTQMKANRGRASYLGERSVGHMDPGAASCALLTGAICQCLDMRQIHKKAECA